MLRAASRSKNAGSIRGSSSVWEFFCYQGSRAAEHAAVLDPDVLQRIAELEAALWIDVYDETPRALG